VAFTEISEEQRSYIEARLAAADRALANARAETDAALSRLDRLDGDAVTESTGPSTPNP
jgi:hypothetical protein